MDQFFQKLWYQRHARWLSLLLWPLSLLFGAVVALRRFSYRRGWLPVVRLPAPVIVVGNISVGGTGKTPFTIWLANRLQSQGWHVGVVLRGYGGSSREKALLVSPDSDWRVVGDEAVLIARSSGAIVAVGADRVAAARLVMEQGAQLVLSDDGMQHYRLQRDCEIAVLDERRMLGNGRLLPAGPLREPPGRLQSVALQVLSRRPGQAAGRQPEDAVVAMGSLGEARSLLDGSPRALEDFRGAPVHAVAAIGNPGGFFAALRDQGLQVVEHAFADHQPLQPEQLRFGDDAAVLMTEKDAVKFSPETLAGMHAGGGQGYWSVPLQITLSETDQQRLDDVLIRALTRVVNTQLPD